MKNIFRFLALSFVVLAMGVQAQTTDTMGLYFAVDTAAAGFTPTGDNSGDTEFGFGLGVRGGYSISSQAVILAEFVGGMFESGNVDNTSTALLIGTELTPMDNLFIRPTAGISWLNVDGNGVDNTTDAGFAAGLATGYQFTLNNNLSVGPTLRGNYNSIADADASLWSYGLGAELQARF